MVATVATVAITTITTVRHPGAMAIATTPSITTTTITAHAEQVPVRPMAAEAGILYLAIPGTRCLRPSKRTGKD